MSFPMRMEAMEATMGYMFSGQTGPAVQNTAEANPTRENVYPTGVIRCSSNS